MISPLKEDVINIMSDSNGYQLNRFMKAIVSLNKITYKDELRHLESRIELMTKHQQKFSINLNENQEEFKIIRTKLNILENELKKPKLHHSKKKKLAKELHNKLKKLKLLGKEIESLRRMRTILDDLNIENKEKLSKIKREIERKALNV
jgi:hypothetical protein